MRRRRLLTIHATAAAAAVVLTRGGSTSASTAGNGPFAGPGRRRQQQLASTCISSRGTGGNSSNITAGSGDDGTERQQHQATSRPSFTHHNGRIIVALPAVAGSTGNDSNSSSNVLSVETGSLTLAQAKAHCARHADCVAFTYPMAWSFEDGGLNHLPNVTFVSMIGADDFVPSRHGGEWRTYVTNDSDRRAEFVRSDALLTPTPRYENQDGRQEGEPLQDVGQGGATRCCCDRTDLPSIDQVRAADTTLPRISCRNITRAEFYRRYELTRTPVMLVGCASDWGATTGSTHWTYAKLAQRFDNSSRWRARLGSETEEYAEGVEWKHIVDAMYAERSDRNDGNKGSSSKDNRSRTSGTSDFYVFDPLDDGNLDKLSSIESDYTVPHPIQGADMYSEMNERGVYFEGDNGKLRWFVMGRYGSGTHVHNDPFATDAWNTLVGGHKWWVIFPPAAMDGRNNNQGNKDGGSGGREIIDESLKCDPSCSTRSSKPFVREWAASIGTSAARTELPGLPPHSGDNSSTNGPPAGRDMYPYHVLQEPGETIFVPHGRVHSVVNLDDTVAVTANYASPANLDEVWKSVCVNSGADGRMWKIMYYVVLNAEQRRRVRRSSRYWPPWKACSKKDDNGDSAARLHAPRPVLEDVLYDHEGGWLPQEGDIVEARYRGNLNEYYRARVHRVKNKNEDGATTYHVHYLDEGKDKLPRRALRKYALLKEGELVHVWFTPPAGRNAEDQWLLAAVAEARLDGTVDLRLPPPSGGLFLESVPPVLVRRFDWQFREGNRVVARWEEEGDDEKDNDIDHENWRSGVVSHARSDGRTYDVRFDDGHYRTLDKELIRYEWATTI